MANSATAVVVQSSDGTTQKQSVQVQPAFPQGSILVVPHQAGGFQAVPFFPVFDNTAVVMPQGLVTTTAGTTPRPTTQSSSKPKKTSSGNGGTTVDSKKETKRNSTVEGVGEGKGGKEKSTAGDLQAAKVDGKKEKEKVGLHVPHASPGLFVPVYALKTSEQVKLESFDFRSKSVEISGEVPIRVIQIGENGEEDTIPLSRLKELVGESTTEPAGEGKAKDVPPSLGKEVLTTSHTSTEVMSAKMLLSLTGRSEVSPLEKEPPRSVGASQATPEGATVASETSVASATTPSSSGGTPNGVGRQTPSGSKGARKRKQKPTPSAKPSASGETQQKEQPKNDTSATATTKPEKTATPAKKRARKTAAKSGAATAGEKSSPQTEKTKGPTRPKKGSQKNSKSVVGGDNFSSASPASLTKEKSSSGKSRVKTASARMEQLKAERGSHPVKEFVIESSSGSDSEESDSSSGTGSTSFSPNSGSSSDSSSDSSSENQQSGDPKPSPQKPAVTARGRVGGGARGRGGRGGRGGGGKRRGGPAAGKGRGKPKSQSSSSEESSGGEEEEGEGEVKKQKIEPSGQSGGRRGKAGGVKGRQRGQPTRGRGRGRGRERKGGDNGHIVSIPTDLLESLPSKKRQRKTEVSFMLSVSEHLPTLYVGTTRVKSHVIRAQNASKLSEKA